MHRHSRSRVDDDDLGDKINLEMALEKLGGFGMFQFVITVAMCVWRNSGMAAVYMYFYLILPQTYLCRTEQDAAFETCDAHSVICPRLAAGEFVEYEVDKESFTYLENWQQEMDLMCEPESKLMINSTVYFIAFGIGGILSFPLLDRIGRLRFHWIFSTLHLLAQITAVMVPNWWARLGAFCMMGLCMGKNSLCYTWLFEFMLKRHKPTASTLINLTDMSTAVVTCTYFWVISKDWYTLFQGYLIAAVGSYLILTLLCPESPKWLLLQGRRQEAIRVLNFIGKINRSKRQIAADTDFVEAAIAGNLDQNVTYDHGKSVSRVISELAHRAMNVTGELSFRGGARNQNSILHDASTSKFKRVETHDHS